MPLVHDREARMVGFDCSECGTVLGYTSPGEAESMNRRALHLCAECVTKVPALTDKQAECIEVARALRESLGRTPFYDEIAEALGGVARSRVSALVAGIRERGHEAEWLDALYGDAKPLALT